MEVRISELETEISKLSAALNIEKAYRLELEDERNFLLGENTALREQLSRLRTTKCNAQHNDAQLNTLACSNTTTIIATHSGKKVLQISGACGDKNAICCAFYVCSDGWAEQRHYLLWWR
jgi:regulator of replication initiation timing